MAKKPALKTVLYAGETEVASSTDSQVWLDTMAAITGDRAPAGGRREHKESDGAGSKTPPANGGSGPVSKFASELGVEEAELVGAATPSTETPYIHLDHKYWEALKQNTPPRGVGSVPGVVLAATLLLLWNRHSNFGKVSGAMCDDVLRTIGHEERNRARSLRGCEWIQVREDGLRLNPAAVPAAVKLARAYVTRLAPQ
jgi:hypothetical protein